VSRAKAVRRGAVALAALLVLALIGGAIATVVTVRRSLPQTSGELRVAGLASKVSVLRDAQGVPQIYADTAADLFRAQGYVAAQDRFFQMDLRRHVTAGRLAEMVGPSGLETDKVIRTLGWRRVAQAELPTLASSTQQYLQAYADGVNAYLEHAGSPSHLGLEYAVLSRSVNGYRVEPWTPADSLAWLKAIAWDLKGNYADEITRARLSRRVSPARLAALYPAYPFSRHAPILSTQDWYPGAPASGTPVADPGTDPGTDPAGAVPTYLRAKDDQRVYAAVLSALDQVPAAMGNASEIGSNSWVVGPSRSTTGKPLLANDPHLAVGIPGIWYQSGLHCRRVSAACPFDVSGFSFAGLPGIVTGHNQSIAWGVTNLDPDVTDLYLEQIQGSGYLRDGHEVAMQTRAEVIKVAGGADVSITVRSTVHGPLVSDVLQDAATAGVDARVPGRLAGGVYAVSLAWTGLQGDQTADALFELDTAQNFAEFRKAASRFAVPSQNLVYADVHGHIGYQAPGKVPIRASATRGAVPGYWPSPGWTSKYDWKGYVPFDQMPSSYDPPEGYIVAANQAVTSSQTPFLTSEWDAGYRSQRIRDLIAATRKVSPARMSRIQDDTFNGFAPLLTKYLRAVKVNSFTHDAQRLLKGWNYTEPSGRSRSAASAAYFNAVWNRLLEYTFDDELPQGLDADGGGRWMLVVSQLLDKPSDPWWDDRATAGLTEGRDEILRRAMTQARLDLTQALGKNPVTWQWGRLHRLTLRSTVLGGDSVPAYVRRLFNRGAWDMPGGSAIVNANAYDAAATCKAGSADCFSVTHAPSMRMIVDLGSLDASRWVDQTGVSGHPFDRHYADQVDAWVAGRTFAWPFSVRAVRAVTEDELTLSP
jgi:penicillin amidase